MQRKARHFVLAPSSVVGAALDPLDPLDPLDSIDDGSRTGDVTVMSHDARHDESAAVLADGDAPPGARPFQPRRKLVPSSMSWASEYPFRSRWFQPLTTQIWTDAQDVQHKVVTPGYWQHFLDEGPKDAPVLVFLHGNPTWSFYWRKLIVGLRERYRCIAIDHLGMGLSDRPQDDATDKGSRPHAPGLLDVLADPYRLGGHITRAEALLEALQVKEFTLIGHDWGGCIAAGVATRRPDRVRSIVWMNTGAFLSQDIPFSIALCRIPVLGEVAVRAFNAFAASATYRAMMKHDRMTDVVKAGYLDPYRNWDDRVATLRFVQDIPLDSDHPSYSELSKIEAGLVDLKSKPIALFWGDADFCFTRAFRLRFEKEFPAAEVAAWADCGHYVVEDAHERILPLLTSFLQKHHGAVAARPSTSMTSGAGSA